MGALDHFLTQNAAFHNLDDLLRARRSGAFVCVACGHQHKRDVDTCHTCLHPFIVPAERLIVAHFNRRDR